MSNENEVVYFIKKSGSNLVKIGYTSNLKSRLSSIMSASGDFARVLAYLKGGREKELEIHTFFKNKRYKGEWFFLDDEMRFYILKNCEIRFPLKFNIDYPCGHKGGLIFASSTEEYEKRKKEIFCEYCVKYKDKEFETKVWPIVVEKGTKKQPSEIIVFTKTRREAAMEAFKKYPHWKIVKTYRSSGKSGVLAIDNKGYKVRWNYEDKWYERY